MIEGNCIVTGTNTAGAVSLLLHPELSTLTISNLVLQGRSVMGYTPFFASTANACSIVLAGENSFMAGPTAAALTVHNAFSVRLQGTGTLTARGGSGGAGIGGDSDMPEAGHIQVAGGTVFATGGGGAVAIGSLANAGSSNGETEGDETEVDETEGPRTGCAVVFTGGSVAPDNFSPAPSNGTDRVWCVKVVGLSPGAMVSFDGLDGYGTEGIRADGYGWVYLWLPDGTYEFHSGNMWWRAEVAGADTTAERIPTPAVLMITHVEVTTNEVKITVASIPPEFIEDDDIELRVRARAALPFTGESSELLRRHDVQLDYNGGTATLFFDRPEAERMFYRVEGNKLE